MSNTNSSNNTSIEKKKGRKKLADKRRIRTALAATNTEWERIKRAAKAEKMSINGYVLQKALERIPELNDADTISMHLFDDDEVEEI